jgi:tRNA threonylcarbamoyladenosine modification (KEOPS) complex Cgi121 subunit
LIQVGWTPKIKCLNCKVFKNRNISLKELKIKYSSHQYHAKIRQDSRTEYKKSKRPLVCKVCNYSKHIEVCHIKAIKSFSEDSTIAEINALENLVALCPNHHWEFDNGILVFSA